MKISSKEITKDENIEALNRILKDKNIRIEKDEDSEDIHCSCRIFENNKIIFHTIHPKELLIKIAQLIPESEVTLGPCEVPVDKPMKETLIIEI
jgi:hypothetical protein